MTTQLSYFHLGHVTVKDTELHITTLYTTLEVRMCVCRGLFLRSMKVGKKEKIVVGESVCLQCSLHECCSCILYIGESRKTE